MGVSVGGINFLLSLLPICLKLEPPLPTSHFNFANDQMSDCSNYIYIHFRLVRQWIFLAVLNNRFHQQIKIYFNHFFRFSYVVLFNEFCSRCLSSRFSMIFISRKYIQNVFRYKTTIEFKSLKYYSVSCTTHILQRKIIS